MPKIETVEVNGVKVNKGEEHLAEKWGGTVGTEPAAAEEVATEPAAEPVAEPAPEESKKPKR